jgi:N-terminal domain of galactosyltransferase
MNQSRSYWPSQSTIQDFSSFSASHTAAGRDNLKLSFFTTCMGRSSYLAQTLRPNIENSRDWPNVEFVVLAYGDPETTELVKRDFHEEIASEKIRLWETKAPYYVYADSRNMAARLATGAVAINLDADNIMAPGYARWIGGTFSKDMNIVVRAVKEGTHFPQRRFGGGGLMAFSMELFRRVGGYDRRISFWGGEDQDLALRMVAAGATFIRSPEDLLGTVLVHGDELRFAKLSEEDRTKSEAAMAVSNAGWERISRMADEGKLYRDEEVFRGLQRPMPGLKPVVNLDEKSGLLVFGCGDVVRVDVDPRLGEFRERPLTLRPISAQHVVNRSNRRRRPM